MKKKILLITGGFNPELAGGAKQAETIINALKNDFDFTILSFSKKFNNNISVYKKIFRIKIYYNLFFVKTIFKTIIYFIKYKKKFEIIHLRGSTKKNILLIFLALALRKKIIYTPTRFLEDDLNTIKKKNYLLFFLLKKYATIHCISPIFFTLANSFIKKKFKYIYIPNLVDSKKFFYTKKKNKVIKIICVGFFSKIKNQMLVYKAFKSIVLGKKINLKIKLIFVGSKKTNYFLSDNSIYKFVYKDAKKNKILDKLQFINFSKNIEKLYQKCDIFVLPSITEGMPNSLLEAMSCGLTCIVSKLKNITTNIISHKKNGYLFTLNNLKELEKFLIYALRSKKLRNFIGLNARKTINKYYSLETNLYKYKKFYLKFK